ncbi:Uncharacterised protein [Mycobacterium tuberculosis]|uniref:Uncharacterized protein n=1 Tax=Mycobacterium tuberculosis TaxID=1773 RepID=A0A655IC75_MYCTX|nr:Uncharacterised protein [Mycobacterium tuberculosis]CKO69728.1 Uncharacterised protein [Mycobacterium tuberculosis]CKR13171.1 Uncharacterised protein [Mycobacterium tuberculosis]CKR13582.1 Uncharacterised protein [Mycobacterium tuberculosis]CKR80264.1 Uncharacterised protein [Mycobacterium tuberculosis]
MPCALLRNTLLPSRRRPSVARMNAARGRCHTVHRCRPRRTDGTADTRSNPKGSNRIRTPGLSGRPCRRLVCGTDRCCFGRTSTRQSGRHSRFRPSRRPPPAAGRNACRGRPWSAPPGPARPSPRASRVGMRRRGSAASPLRSGPTSSARPAAVRLTDRPMRSVLLTRCERGVRRSACRRSRWRHIERCRTRAQLGSSGRHYPKLAQSLVKQYIRYESSPPSR